MGSKGRPLRYRPNHIPLRPRRRQAKEEDYADPAGFYALPLIISGQPIDPIELIAAKQAIRPGETIRLNALPKDAKGYQEPVKIFDLEWRSSNSGVASVDQFGKATGLSAGEAKITMIHLKTRKAASLPLRVEKRAP
ncbi:MAG: Ig-like domain-containing protein [Armatimonadetes bacterium]|nr:Ig-like domain-containing protein [Armatimonadota bacterium]